MKRKYVVLYGTFAIAAILYLGQLSPGNQVSILPDGPQSYDSDPEFQTEGYAPVDAVLASSSLSPLGRGETAFYGTATNDSIRNLVGYADYVVVSHPLYDHGEPIKENVRYLATHGVKVILDATWWDVWPFDGVVDRYAELHFEDLAWGMNGTESVKYRIQTCIDTIGAEYIWGVTIDEEVGDSDVENFPWPLIAWYQNLFCDWMHSEYPAIKVFAWPAPPNPEFVSNSQYHIRADGVVYDNYDQNITRMGEIASYLKSKYPDGPLLFLVSAAETIGGWYTCHPPTYLKRVIPEVLRYADIVGFWTMTEESVWGWEDDQNPGYQLALRMCDQIHLTDWHTIYGNTEWFESGFGNDTVTESLSNWYTTTWYETPPDPSAEIALSTDQQVGSYSINLTCVDSGLHSYWWQFGPGHYRGYPDWEDTGPYGAYNLTQASRITFWVKGEGWDVHPEATVRMYLEKSNYPSPTGKIGNLTLPEITSYLTDGLWHQVSIALPLDSSAYCQWDGYASQIHIEVDYDHNVAGDTTSIFLDGWTVDSFDTGKALGLSDQSDYVAVDNGTLEVGGGAYFEIQIPESDSWYYQYSGTGDIEMCLNGTWTAPPDEAMPCYWNLTGIRLSNGSFDWIKVNAIPPLVEILSPGEGDLVSGTCTVEVNVTDESGIERVEFAVDGTLEHTDFVHPFSWDWDTTGHTDGLHRLNATAYATSGAVNFYHLQLLVDNTAPMVEITSPINETTVAATVAVESTASDASGIQQVRFYVDGGFVASSSSAPFRFDWDTTVYSDDSRTLSCVATDNAGNENSSMYVITVDNTAPVLYIHSLSVWGDSGLMAVNTTDPSGIDRVEFYLDGSLEYTDYSYPYQWEWSGAALPDGTHTFSARSYDNMGHSSLASSGVQVDNTQPTLSVMWTPSGTTLSGVVAFDVSASDANGIAYVEFYLDGTLQFTDYFGPYEWTWDTTLSSDEEHSVTVIAADSRGNSKQIVIELEVDNTGPVVVINSPADSSVLEGPCTITVRATVLDQAGLADVILSYRTGVSWIDIAMVPSGNQYEATITGLLPGEVVWVYVSANDSLGNDALSTTFAYYIVDTTAPSVSVTLAPIASVYAGDLEVDMLSSDSSGVSMVILYVDGVQMVVLDDAPYDYLLDTGVLTDGPHTIRVWSNDTWDNSDYVEITIQTDNSAPSLSVVAPANETIYDAPAQVNIEASAADPRGLSNVLVFFDVGTGWTSEPMVLQGSRYVWNSSLYSTGTTLAFYVFVNDTLGNWRTSSYHECMISDLSGPLIGAPSLQPEVPTSFDTVTVTTSISDHSGVDTAVLSYSVDSGPWINVTLALSSEYWASIPAMTTGTVITYRFYANDTLGHWQSSPVYQYTVVPFDVLPPEVASALWTPVAPDDAQDVQVSLEATDPSGVVEVILSYHDGLQWHNITMVLYAGEFIGTIPAQEYGITVTLKAYACDGQDNWGITPIGSYSVSSSDLEGPELSLFTWTPLVPTEEDSVEVYAEISDTNAVLHVILCYEWESTCVNTSMLFNGSGYVAFIPVHAAGTQVSLRVYSCDGRDNWAASGWGTYNVIASDSTPPSITGIDWSPTSPYTNESIEVTASVDDTSIITLVLLEYYDGHVWRNQTMHADAVVDSQFSALIPPIGAAGTVEARIYALDAEGNWGVTSAFEIVIREIPESTTTAQGLPMSEVLVIGLVSTIAVGVPLGVVIALAGLRMLRKRSGSG